MTAAFSSSVASLSALNTSGPEHQEQVRCQAYCRTGNRNREAVQGGPQNGQKIGPRAGPFGTTRHYVAQECPLHLVVHPRYPSRAPRACVYH